MIRILALCIALIAGCGGQTQPSTRLHIHTTVNDAGELWVRVNNGEPLRLLHDARGYRPLVSPNGEWMAVEVRLMSDLDVVRLFRRDGNRFVAADKDITAAAWRQVAANEKIELEAMDRTKARVLGWSNEGTTLRLELSALVPGEKNLLGAVVGVPLDINRVGGDYTFKPPPVVD